MNRIICIAFFIAGALLLGKDLIEFYNIQHQVHETALVPLILLGILAHFAFQPAPKAKPEV